MGGWDVDGRPSAIELAWHTDALRRDAGCGLFLLGLFGASAALFSADKTEHSQALLAEAVAGTHLWRGALGSICALGAASALAVDLFVCPCAAKADPKYRAIRPLGHFAYLTVQCLSIITVHLTLSAVVECLIDPLFAPVLPTRARRALVVLHTACHMHAEWVTAVSICLALLFYPLALLIKQWELEEVVPWQRRGVPAFKALNLYSHGAAVPFCVLDLVALKSPHLLNVLAPRFAELATWGAAYSCLYPISVHIGYNLHYARARHARRVKEEQAAAGGAPLPRVPSVSGGHAWPYGFMNDLTILGPPPPALHGWGVRPPFSIGWVVLALTGGAVHLLVLAGVRRMHVGA